MNRERQELCLLSPASLCETLRSPPKTHWLGLWGIGGQREDIHWWRFLQSYSPAPCSRQNIQARSSLSQSGEKKKKGHDLGLNILPSIIRSRCRWTFHLNLQGFLASEAAILEIEAWGLGGRVAREQQEAYKRREQLFSEQRRMVGPRHRMPILVYLVLGSGSTEARAH